ncbi:MAG: HlyD family efflux transporter periplasmic adaptor subunit [Betaproteobacteria bacterium]|nr:HlyD family efflux transporter periplasmic adaptor subunit [Betaproteobacteria bacterium]
MKIMHMLACAATCGALATLAYAQDISLTATQIESLGISTAAPEHAPANEIAGLAAEVMVPNSQLHVVSAPLPGLVESVLVAVNDRVKKGQVLARMRSSALAEAQRAYLQAHTQQQLAKANLDRDGKLAKEGLIAESRLLSTRATYTEASARLAELHQALGLAGMSDRDIARLRAGAAISSSVAIRSPVTAVVVEQLSQAGQRLDAYAPMYKLAQMDPLWLEIQVPVARAATMHEGATVRVPAADASGRVISIGRNVTPESQTLMLRAVIDHNASALRPGQYVEATVSTEGGNVVRWQIPAAALIRARGGVFVFGATSKGFRPIPVRIVNEGATVAVVTGDLEGVTGIAVTGVSSLKARFMGLGE